MHTVSIRIYLEDTDAEGIVYHASYLRFAERARTEFFRNLGFPHKELMRGMYKEESIMLVVVNLDIHFKKPLFLDDILEIKTKVKNVTKTKFCLEQSFWKENFLIAQLNCTLACVKKMGKPVAIPLSIIEAL